MPFSQAVDSRVLLTRLRATLAEHAGGQERLDRIVRLVAEGLVADVCSVYLRRDDSWLELCATEGLKPESVHLSRLRVGQGLVGQIAETAEPINTRDAFHTRGFRYLPETGEEGLESFLGVPVQRLGEVLGVLVVQNREPRDYTDDEVYALEVIAMVIAEMAELGAFVGPGAMELARPHRLPFYVQRLRRPGGRRRGHRGAARAADRRRRPDHRRPDPRAGAAARRDRGAQGRGRRDAGGRLSDLDRRAPRRAERLPDVRPRQGLGPAAGGVGRERAGRRGGGREGAVGDPHPHEPLGRPLPPRAAARSRRPVEPPAAAARRQRPAGRPRAARGRDPRRPQHRAGRAARLRPQAPRRGARGGLGGQPRGDRRARPRDSPRHPGRSDHPRGDERRPDPRRRRPRPRAPAPRGERRQGLPREGRHAARGAGRLCGAARQAGDDARRGDAAAAHERRADGRPPEPAEVRRGRGRPVPDRAAVPGALERAEAVRARRALRPHPRRGARQARRLPHPRHRLGQGAALHEAHRRAEPGARLARDPGRARSPGDDADAGAGADPRGEGAAADDHVPLRHRVPRVRGRAGRWSSPRWNASTSADIRCRAC